MNRKPTTKGRWDAVYDHLRRKDAPAPPPPPPPRGPGPQNFGYFRVSTARQGDEGYSLEAQKATIEKYAAAKELGGVQFFVDSGVSASKTPLAGREAGRVLTERVRPGDRVIITKIDRGFRNFADFIHWHDAWTTAGIQLHIVDFIGANMDSTTALGRLMVRQLALFAAWESECNSERVRAAYVQKRAEGYLAGSRAPMGFKAKKSGKGWIAVPDPDARRLMGMMVAWHDAGQGYRAIAAHLEKHKVPPLGRDQKQWNQMRVMYYIHAERKLQDAEKGEVTA